RPTIISMKRTRLVTAVFGIGMAAAVVVGCEHDNTATTSIAIACERSCECEHPYAGPAGMNSCISTCEGQIGGNATIGDACLQCIESADCDAVVNICNGACGIVSMGSGSATPQEIQQACTLNCSCQGSGSDPTCVTNCVSGVTAEGLSAACIECVNSD